MRYTAGKQNRPRESWQAVGDTIKTESFSIPAINNNKNWVLTDNTEMNEVFQSFDEFILKSEVSVSIRSKYLKSV